MVIFLKNSTIEKLLTMKLIELKSPAFVQIAFMVFTNFYKCIFKKSFMF